MWRVVAAVSVTLMLTAAVAGDAWAETNNANGANGRIVDLAAQPPRDISGRIVDLIVKSDTVSGKAQSLEVKETSLEIKIELSADILFDFDKADIKPVAADALKQVATIIIANANKRVRIGGYTDAKGADAYNLKLSRQRAQSVMDWLTKKEGLTSTKFDIKGYGAKDPVAPNTNLDGSDNPEGRQKNRRVELIIAK